MSLTLLDDPNFLEFYVTAKKNTYAAGGDEKAQVLRNGGKRYVFYDGERWPQWRYVDIYHGYNPFFGNETIDSTTPSVWTPIARMSYNGSATGAPDKIKAIFDLLRKRSLYEIFALSVSSGEKAEGTVLEDDLEYSFEWERTGVFCARGEKHIRTSSKTSWCDVYFQFSTLC